MRQRCELQDGRTGAGYYQIPHKAIRVYVANLGTLETGPGSDRGDAS